MANNLETAKKEQIVSMLAEGSSICAIERITGVHRDTVMRLGVRVGEECLQILDDKIRDLNCRQIEVDEIWGFIGKKAKNADSGDRAAGLGDVWTFIALDADTKIIPTFKVGKRDSYHAKAFMDDLAGRLKNRVRAQIVKDVKSGYST